MLHFCRFKPPGLWKLILSPTYLSLPLPFPSLARECIWPATDSDYSPHPDAPCPILPLLLPAPLPLPKCPSPSLFFRNSPHPSKPNLRESLSPKKNPISVSPRILWMQDSGLRHPVPQEVICSGAVSYIVNLREHRCSSVSSPPLPHC